MAAVKELLFFCVFKALGLYACKLVAYFPKRRLAGVKEPLFFCVSRLTCVCVQGPLCLSTCTCLPKKPAGRLVPKKPAVFASSRLTCVCVQGPLCLSTRTCLVSVFSKKRLAVAGHSTL